MGHSVVNFVGVEYFGTMEFWLASGKILLFLALTFYTIITMSGGNPHHYAYGFEQVLPQPLAPEPWFRNANTRPPRNWKKPAPFIEYHTTGSMGIFLGFMGALSQAAITVTGPEYVSMTAGEVEMPRRVMPKAFKAVFYRLGIIFVVGALTVGIVVPPSSEELVRAYTENGTNAAASPYVVSMRSFGIPVLPHIVNALLLTSAISAGNGYMYCASRTLYGLALAGKAPKFFTRTTKKGVPIYPTLAVLVVSLISFLQVSSDSSVVFSWLISLVSSLTRGHAC